MISSWIAYSKPSPDARVRLFCFPHAGGGASLYRSWSDNLPPAIEVCPIQPPGREGRLGERPFTRIEPLVRAVSETILPLLDRPFAFFGHSLGARISFELAKELRRSHRVIPAHLFVSACPAPQLPKNGSTYDLPNDKFLEKLRVLNGTPGKVMNHKRLMRLLLPTIRADFEVYDTYAYSPCAPFDCPITVLAGAEDPVVSLDQLVPWRDHTRSDFWLTTIPGGHFFVHTSRPLVLGRVSEALLTALESNGHSLHERPGSPSTQSVWRAVSDPRNQ